MHNRSSVTTYMINNYWYWPIWILTTMIGFSAISSRPTEKTLHIWTEDASVQTEFESHFKPSGHVVWIWFCKNRTVAFCCSDLLKSVLDTIWICQKCSLGCQSEQGLSVWKCVYSLPSFPPGCRWLCQGCDEKPECPRGEAGSSLPARGSGGGVLEDESRWGAP